jgi:hypothetical protein
MIAFPVFCYFSVITRPVNMAIHVSIPAVLDLDFTQLVDLFTYARWRNGNGYDMRCDVCSGFVCSG